MCGPAAPTRWACALDDDHGHAKVASRVQTEERCRHTLPPSQMTFARRESAGGLFKRAHPAQSRFSAGGLHSVTQQRRATGRGEPLMARRMQAYGLLCGGCGGVGSLMKVSV